MGGMKTAGSFGGTWDWWDNPESIGHVLTPVHMPST